MEGKFSVYIIRCNEGKLYIGLSSDTEKRIDSHNKKLSAWTSRFTNWEKIYKKEFDNYTEARKWEIYLKKQKGGNGLKKILAEQEDNNPAKRDRWL
jgi:predicted GIY-YIG superfamily endonuclease